MSSYQSARRQRQAEATRRDILMAARRLFAERGYGATTMTEIAAAAGVAVQTIYASCGSKRELVLGLVDLIGEEAGVDEMANALRRAEDPLVVIEFGVRLTRQLNERCGDILGALRSAASLEQEAAAAVDEANRRHRLGAEAGAKRLAQLRALRSGISAPRASAILAALTSFGIWTELTREHGWSFDEAERWIASAASAAVLR